MINTDLRTTEDTTESPQVITNICILHKYLPGLASLTVILTQLSLGMLTYLKVIKNKYCIISRQISLSKDGS